MQQCLLVSLMAIALLFTGCGGSGDSAPVGNSSIDFTTTGFSGLRPSMLNLIASTDGTLNIPNSDGSEIIAAMNRQDGWALSQPIIMTMSSADGQNLGQPSFSTAPGAIQPIYLLEVSYSDVAKVPTGVASVLLPGTDFSALASDQSLYIIPLKPLKPGSYYSVILTNRLADASGKTISAADSYLAARNSSSTASTDVAAKALITAQEGIAAAIGIAQEDLVLTDTFRTTSVGDSLRMLKLAASTIVTNAVNGNRSTTATDVWSAGDSLSTTYEGIYDIDLSVAPLGNLTQVLADTAATPQGPAADSSFDAASAAALNASIPALGLGGVAAITQVYKTTVKLPYFLGHPGQHAMAPGISSWRGSSPSLVSIIDGLSAGGDTATTITNALTAKGVDSTRLTNLFNGGSASKGELATEVLKMAGLNILVPDGNGGAQALDSERNVTRYNSLPAPSIVTDVPVLIFSPGPIAAADKVVIFQHGITSVKENVYPIVAGIIASGLGAAPAQNIAVVAIDLPLHGERGFPDFLTDSDNPGIYANLAFLSTARDNVRQSSADLLGLRAALAFANRKAAATIGVGKDLKVSFVGHSLGGIVGTNFVAIANEISDYVGIDNSMFKIDETILAMAGSMIAHIMLESAAFGPIVKHDVAVSGSPTLSAAFEQFKPLCEDSSEKTCFTTQFIPTLPAEDQAELDSTFTQFAFAAQTVLDAADPIGIAKSIVATNPLYVVEVVGDKATNLPDQVVPNAAGLSGTEILIRELGLADLDNPVVGSTVRHAVRYTVGGHGSLIAPDAVFDPTGTATAEMQTQMGTFFAADGQSLPISNSNVICRDTAANCLP